MSPPAAFPAFLSALLQLWTDKRGDRTMPARRDFRTVDLEPWLSELHLVAVRPEGLRFIVFAVGPASRYGREMTGRYVSELEPAAMADDVERAYLTAVETRAPVLGTQVTQPFGGARRTWSRLILPLSDDGTAVDRLLVAVWDDAISLAPRTHAAHALLLSKWTMAETFETEIPQSIASPPRAAERTLTVAAE